MAMEMKRKDKAIAGLLVVLIVFLFVRGQMNSEKNGFSTEKWTHYTGNARQNIVQDFLDRNNVVGWDEGKLTENLGAPEEETDTYWLYYLGNPTGNFGVKESPEVEYLLFYFEDGKVTDREILTEQNLPETSTFHPEEMEGSVFYPTEEE